MSFTISFADRYIAGESEAKALAQKRCERKFIIARIARRFGGYDVRSCTFGVGSHGSMKLKQQVKCGG